MYIKFIYTLGMACCLTLLPHAGKATPHSTFRVQKAPQPQFPGGDGEWRKFLERNINRDISVMEDNAKPGCYTVRGSFLVDANGNISDIQFVENSFPKVCAELRRVLKSSPKWLSATDNGKPVASRKEISYQFLIDTE